MGAFEMVLARDRHAPRRSIRSACEVVRERGFKRIGQRMVDLSQAGMQVELDGEVLTGEIVFVTFKLPFADAWIDAEGTVARVSHGRRPLDRGATFGLLLDFDRDARTVVRAHLRGLPPTIAMRPNRIDVAATVRAISVS